MQALGGTCALGNGQEVTAIDHPRDIAVVLLSPALLARLRAYCERRVRADPRATGRDELIELAVSRMLDLLERVYPPSENEGETT